ncbi:MAG TPA: SMP-30/gluconolactonase/LRE family protein [archaeon]|nr:SMP-30/gluconolactonase/LRE family protein [archaeon]
MNESNAQDALKYLPIAGGIVLIATLAIFLIIGASTPATANTQQSILNSLCAGILQNDCTTKSPAQGCAGGTCEWKGNICTGVSADNRGIACFSGTKIAASGCGTNGCEADETCLNCPQDCGACQSTACDDISGNCRAACLPAEQTDSGGAAQCSPQVCCIPIQQKTCTIASDCAEQNCKIALCTNNSCSWADTTACIGGDQCCPSLCTPANDPDCQSITCADNAPIAIPCICGTAIINSGYCCNGTTTQQSQCAQCGNNNIETGETCDPPGSINPAACTTTGGYPGTQTCATDCKSWNACTSTQSCGDGTINGTETCDGTNLNNQTCITQGYNSGTLACNANCTFNTGQCVPNQTGTLSVSPAATLTSSGTFGGPFAPNSIVYTLTNTGTTNINWTAAKTAAWIDINKTSGAITAGTKETIKISINASANSLAAGTFSDTITFTNTTNGNGNTTRAAALTVSLPTATLTVTPAGGLNSTGTFGGPFNPDSQIYTLTNTGTASITWTAAKTAAWMDINKTSGTITAGTKETIKATINATANSLAAGTFSDTITFTNNTNGNGNTTRTISLTIISAPQANWVLLNSGMPIDTGPETADAYPVSTANAVYYFFGSTLMNSLSQNMFMGRLNLQSKNWELFTENGWNAGQNSIPVPLSLTETTFNSANTTMRAFEFPANTVFGLYQGTRKTLPSSLDEHGNSFNFILSENSLQKWNGGGNFTGIGGQGIVYSWNGSLGDLAINSNGSILAAANYGYAYGSPQSKITMLKYFPQDASSVWKLWDGSGWKNWTSAYRTEYVSVPSAGVPVDKAYGYPMLAFDGSINAYWLVFYNIPEKKTCIARFYDSQSGSPYWEWWNGNYKWQSTSTFNCTDVASRTQLTWLMKKDIFPLGNGKISILFFNPESQGYLYEVFFDGQRWTFSPVAIEPKPSSYAWALDREGILHIAFSVQNAVFEMQRTASGWSEKKAIYLFPAGSNVTLKSLVFLQDNTPVAFLIQNKRLYAIAGNSIGDNQQDKTISILQQQFDPGKIALANSWNDFVSGQRYSVSTVGGQLAFSNGTLYSPISGIDTVNVHTQETDDISDGFYWGYFWDCFSFPSGIAIDNARQRVYISGDIDSGGAGGLVGNGTVKSFDLSYGNQSINCGYPAAFPSGSRPVTINGFSFPGGVAIDETNGFLYVSNSLAHNIKKYNVLDALNPVLLATIGSEGTGNMQFKFPQGITVDSQGNLYVADSGNHRIQKFDSQGNYITSFGGNYGFGTGKLLYPYGISADPTYNIVYVTDPLNNQISLYSKTGAFLYSWNVWVGGKPPASIGGIVAYGNGDFTVAYKQGLTDAFARLARFSIVDKTDSDSDLIPDNLEPSA